MKNIIIPQTALTLRTQKPLERNHPEIWHEQDLVFHLSTRFTECQLQSSCHGFPALFGLKLFCSKGKILLTVNCRRILTQGPCCPYTLPLIVYTHCLWSRFSGLGSLWRHLTYFLVKNKSFATGIDLHPQRVSVPYYWGPCQSVVPEINGSMFIDSLEIGREKVNPEFRAYPLLPQLRSSNLIFPWQLGWITADNTETANCPCQ